MKYVFILLVFVIAACTKELDVAIPDNPRKLTLNSIFTPDSTWKVALTADHDIFDNRDFFDLVYDASVIIYQDGNPVDTLVPKMRDTLHYTTNAYNFYSPSGKPSNDKPYEIRASSRRFGSVRAVSSYPDPTPITSVMANLSDNASSESTVTVTFKDPGNVKNYYFMYVSQKFKYYNDFKKDTLLADAALTLSTNDPAFQNNHSSQSGLLFDDGIFDGKEITIGVTLHYYYRQHNEALNVHLRTVSADLYNYLTTSDLQNQGSSDVKNLGIPDPLVQPTIVFSNIENGVGIFAGYSETTYKIH